jgi:hypothetical protein
VTPLTDFADRLIRNIETVIVGKRAQIEMLLVALLCQGHVLIEDVPGTGKTMLARAAAASLGLQFKRVQCTPDLLPNDITGVSVFNQQTQSFDFRPGPVFVNVLLADEINRATPRAQAALLEAMQERQVTVDGVTRPLAAPFVVLATQNPIEFEGTFPLPEAQLDRFLMRLSLGYRTTKRQVLRARAAPPDRDDRAGGGGRGAAGLTVQWACASMRPSGITFSLVGARAAAWTWRWARARAARWPSIAARRPGRHCAGATCCPTTSSVSRRWLAHRLIVGREPAARAHGRGDRRQILKRPSSTSPRQHRCSMRRYLPYLLALFLVAAVVRVDCTSRSPTCSS